MDLLTAQLDDYNKHGVPKLANVHLQCDVTINEEGSIPSFAPWFPFSPLSSIPWNKRLEIPRIPDDQIDAGSSLSRSSLKKHLYLAEERLNSPFPLLLVTCKRNRRSLRTSLTTALGTVITRVTSCVLLLFSCSWVQKRDYLSWEINSEVASPPRCSGRWFL